MPVCSQYDLPEHADHLEALYARLLRMPLVQANQPLVLVIDGLDEAANSFISDLHIPRHLPEGKFIIFPAGARETGRNYLEELGLPSDKVLTINLEQLSYGGVQALLCAADATAWANNPPLVGEVLRVSEGDPFYLHELVQDIASGQITTEQITHKPTSLTAYLDAPHRDGKNYEWFVGNKQSGRRQGPSFCCWQKMTAMGSRS